MVSCTLRTERTWSVSSSWKVLLHLVKLWVQWVTSELALDVVTRLCQPIALGLMTASLWVVTLGEAGCSQHTWALVIFLAYFRISLKLNHALKPITWNCDAYLPAKQTTGVGGYWRRLPAFLALTRCRAQHRHPLSPYRCSPF